MVHMVLVGMVDDRNQNGKDVEKQTVTPRILPHRRDPKAQLLIMWPCHLIALPSRVGRPLRTVRGQSPVRGRPRLLALRPLSATEYAARDGSDQGQDRDSTTNNNGYFVLFEEAVKTKWIGVLELDSAPDDLSLWRWVHWVKTVLFEAARANV